MKFLIAILLTAFLGYVFPLFSFMPWWSFAVASFIVALVIHQKGFKAFLAGFIGLFLLWGGYAFIIDTANEHILSTRIANLLPLEGNYLLLIFITAFIAGLISGLAALTGSYTRTIR